MKKQKEINLTAITVSEDNMDSKLEECFGKSRFFFIADIDNKNYKFLKNPGLEFTNMTGKQAALFLIRNGVKTVVSSNFGVSVKKIFDKNKIQIVILSNKYKFLKDIEWITQIT